MSDHCTTDAHLPGCPFVPPADCDVCGMPPGYHVFGCPRIPA